MEVGKVGQPEDTHTLRLHHKVAVLAANLKKKDGKYSLPSY